MFISVSTEAGNVYINVNNVTTIQRTKSNTKINLVDGSNVSTSESIDSVIKKFNLDK